MTRTRRYNTFWTEEDDRISLELHALGENHPRGCCYSRRCLLLDRRGARTALVMRLNGKYVPDDEQRCGQNLTANSDDSVGGRTGSQLPPK